MTQPDGLPDEREVAVVMHLTGRAYSLTGLETRDPRDAWDYFPKDEWETAVRYLLAAPIEHVKQDDGSYADEVGEQRATVRQAAALLLSKAARHAADTESILGFWVYNKRHTYLNWNHPYLSKQEVEEAFDFVDQESSND